jgi:hypothetical protein
VMVLLLSLLRCYARVLTRSQNTTTRRDDA